MNGKLYDEYNCGALSLMAFIVEVIGAHDKEM